MTDRSHHLPRRRTILRSAAALASAATLLAAGCMVGPNYRRPAVEMPLGWVGTTTAPTIPSTTQATTQAATQPALSVEALRDWWLQFHDAGLNSLIDRCVEQNFDLRSAIARLREARASRIGAASALYPQLNVGGGYSRAGHLSTHDASGTDRFDASLDASWELDIFGGNRRSVEAADANVQVAIENTRDVLVSLTAEVATNYVQLRTYQREIEIAKGNLALQQHSLDLTRRKFAAGLDVGSLDVANAEASVASTLAAIPQLESAERQSIYSLSVLLGRPPGELLAELSPHARVPTTPERIPEGLPSDLLRRRPDIRLAEAQLHAAVANIGVAESDLYPRFSLTGSVGNTSNRFDNLLELAQHAWSIGPSISYPLFDAGRIRSNIEVQRAVAQQQYDNYRSTILTALQDVENALVAFDRETQHRSALAQAAVANRRAVNIAQQLYSAGQTDFLNVLTAQRSLFSSEDALAQSDAAIAEDLISLYRALGGGWGG